MNWRFQEFKASVERSDVAEFAVLEMLIRGFLSRYTPFFEMGSSSVFPAPEDARDN